MRRKKDLEKNKKEIEVQKEMIWKREIVLDLSRELQLKRRVEVLKESGTGWEGYTPKKARYKCTKYHRSSYTKVTMWFSSSFLSHHYDIQLTG